MLHSFSCTASSIASRLYPTRQQPVPPPQGGAGGSFAGGGASNFGGGGGGLSGRTNFLRRSGNSKTSKNSSTTTANANYQPHNANFANYQNCTIVRSHTSHANANYGYVKVAPKILIFPIFVQVGYYY